MGDFFSKLDHFLFDILGLVLPGLIFLSILLFPALFLNNVDSPTEVNNGLINFFQLLLVIKDQFSLDNLANLALILILSYIIGHIVKVFSIIKYDFLVVVFDKSFNKLFLWMYSKYRIKNNLFKKDSQIYKYLKSVWAPFKNTLIKIFLFRPPDYFSDNQNLVADCVRIINERLDANYPNEWGYSIFKFASIVSKQNEMKSLAGNFLAKYNLYRSLAFIFLFTFIYYLIIYNKYGEHFLKQFNLSLPIIIISSIILWFTFHYKYKRYWTLCGNETLVALYCLLNKSKITNAT